VDTDKIRAICRERINENNLSINGSGRLEYISDENIAVEFYIDAETQFLYLIAFLGHPRRENCARLFRELLRKNTATFVSYKPYFSYSRNFHALLLCAAIPLAEAVAETVENSLTHLIQFSVTERLRLVDDIWIDKIYK
jgi:hypothetical protein